MINEEFENSIEELIGFSDIEEKITKNQKIRVKFGIDPTVDTIHIGNAVPLRKLAQLQKIGHKAVLIIGDFTAKIGDPSLKNKTRPCLSDEEIKRNVSDYIGQAGKILDIKAAEIHYNSEWFKQFTLADFLKILQQFTLNQIIERDDFEKRIRMGGEVWMHELIYPILQAYDSVMIKSDLEIGGTDQKFNMLAGRQLQKKMNLSPQAVMTTPLLVGLDGTQKMSKSLGNYISVNEKPDEMFARIMSIPDELILDYYSLCTDISKSDLEKIKQNLKVTNPKIVKQDLASKIVQIYHDQQSAQKSQQRFDKIFAKKELPEEIEQIKVSSDSITLIDFLSENSLVESRNEIRRLVAQNGIKLNHETVTDPETKIDPKTKPIIQIGKRKFYQITI